MTIQLITNSFVQSRTNNYNSSPAIAFKGNSTEPCIQNDEFKKITKSDIKNILATPQCARSDCYLVSSIKTLAKSGFGKQMLKKSMESNPDKSAYKVKYNRYEKDNTYTVTHNKDYEKATGRPDFNPTGAVEKASADLVYDKFSAKPFLLRMYGAYQGVEGNLVSRFMKNLTGEEPINIGDKSMLPLSVYKKETTELLDKIGDKPINKHSFVAGSRLLKTEDGIGTAHYYVVKKVDNKEKTVHLVNPRYVDLSKPEAEKIFDETMKNDGYSQKQIEDEKNLIRNSEKVIKLPYDKFMKNFRSIVGYFKKA